MESSGPDATSEPDISANGHFAIIDGISSAFGMSAPRGITELLTQNEDESVESEYQSVELRKPVRVADSAC